MPRFRNKSKKLEARSKMCWDKKTHGTEDEAGKFAEWANNKFGVSQEPYLCKNCSLYHLSTKRESDEEVG